MSRSRSFSKCLLVFDFNGTLLNRVKKCKENRIKLFSRPDYRQHDSTTPRDWVYVRPFAENLAHFLNSNHDYLEYAFWTSARADNADRLYQIIRPYGFTNPKFIWAQDKCEVNDSAGWKKPIIRKDLRHVWNEYKNEFKIQNIILIDDSEYKAILPHNLLLLKEFDACDHQQDICNSDDLLCLSYYLQKMIDSLVYNYHCRDCLTFIRYNKLTIRDTESTDEPYMAVD